LDTKFSQNKSKPNELTPEQEDVIERNIVWIFGSARSGTSWLGGQLLSHQTKFINEPLIGRHLGYVQPGRIGNIRDIDFFKDSQHYFFSERYKDIWTFYLRKLILNRIYAQIQTFSNKIIIKEPNGSIGADILLQCLPNSRMIFVERDCRDVIDSLIDARKEDSQFTKRFQKKPLSEQNRFSFIEKRSHNLAKNMMRLLQTYNEFNPKLRIMIKYEDLRYNTLELLRKLYDFIEIKIDDTELQNLVDKFSFEKIPSKQKGSGKVRRSATPNKWKENFNAEEKEVMNTIMGETLQKMGYDI